MKDNNIKEKIKPITIIYAVAIFIVVYILAIGIFIYGFNAKNKITEITAKYIPYPAAVVNYKDFITVSELSNNLQSIKKFYESQDFSQAGMRVDFSTEDGQKRLKMKERQLLNKMIEDEAVEILARQNGIKITAEEVQQNVKRKLDEYGTGDSVKENLSKLYGWTLSNFEEKIVKPNLYGEELEKLIVSQNKDDFTESAKEKIEKAKNELENKEDFSEMAKVYSDGLTAGEGGELGWFKKDQLINEVSTAAFSLKKGQRSDIIESVLGYHIIELEDKKTENGEELVKIKQIFARKKTFSDWLDGKIKKMKIYIPLKDYYWDKGKGMVEFSSEEMREFEKNIIENFQGDASLVY